MALACALNRPLKSHIDHLCSYDSWVRGLWLGSMYDVRGCMQLSTVAAITNLQAALHEIILRKEPYAAWISMLKALQRIPLLRTVGNDVFHFTLQKLSAMHIIQIVPNFGIKGKAPETVGYSNYYIREQYLHNKYTQQIYYYI